MKIQIVPAMLGALCLLGAGRSNAGVVLTFAQVGSDVVATTSGSLTIPTSDEGTMTENTTPILGATEQALEFGINPHTDVHPGTVAFELTISGITIGPDSATGDSFGYSDNTVLIVPAGFQRGDVFSPSTTFTWTNQTLDTLGLSYLNSGPRTVWAESPGSSNNIVFSAAPVPEPGSWLLAASSLAAVCLRRPSRR